MWKIFLLSQMGANIPPWFSAISHVNIVCKGKRRNLWSVFSVRSYFHHVFIFCQILHEFKFLSGWGIVDKLQSKLEVYGKTILEFKTNSGKEKLAPIKTKIMATTSDQERKCRYDWILTDCRRWLYAMAFHLHRLHVVKVEILILIPIYS